MKTTQKMWVLTCVSHCAGGVSFFFGTLYHEPLLAALISGMLVGALTIVLSINER